VIGGMWTVPNILTALRLLAVPVLGMVLSLAGDSPGGRVWALALFAAASLTDLADGWLARRWNQCTDFGALADPIADKALVGTALICLSGLGVIPWWATVVVLGRELGVTVLRLTVLSSGVIPASRGGKIKTVTQTVLIVLALATPGWAVGIGVLVVLTVLWTLLTGLDYAAKAAALPRTAPFAAPARPLAPVDHADSAGPVWPAVDRTLDRWRGAASWAQDFRGLRGQQRGGAESSRVTS
jgi:CDP-diacylglycerol--glycerol-3-phosphate 3-phosphatidyltransferase